MKILCHLTLTSLFAVAVLSACGKRSPENSVNESVVSSSAESKDRQLVIFNWDDYLSEEVVAGFEKETGISVKFEYYENLGELTDRFQSTPGAFDLVVVDDITLPEFIEVKLVREIDRDRLTYFKNLDPRYLNQSFDPGNQYSVPYNWGTTLIAYRTDKIKNLNPSWDLLWSPELTGKVVMLDSESDVYSVALLSLGYSVNDEDEKVLTKCTEKLLDQANRIGAIYADLSVAEDSLRTGKAWAALMYSGDAGMLAEEDSDIGYFIPKEGAPLWLDSLVISRDARNYDEAHEFLNYLLRAEVAAMNSNYLWTGTPNAAATEFLDPELVADEGIYPPVGILEKCEFFASPSASRNMVMNRGMKELLDTSREHPRVIAAQSEDEASSE